MFHYPSGQMSHCFTNISVICIVQTFEFIDYIGQQRQGSADILLAVILEKWRNIGGQEKKKED